MPTSRNIKDLTSRDISLSKIYCLKANPTLTLSFEVTYVIEQLL